MKAPIRYFIPRQLLLRFSADCEFAIGEDELNTLRIWLGNRYSRTAFPDAFNDRIRPARKKLAKALKKTTDRISSIYMSINPFGELTEDSDYKIVLSAIMPNHLYENMAVKAESEQHINNIAAILDKCTGISVEDFNLVSERSYSLEDIRYSRRWDLDSYSLNEESEKLLPADKDTYEP